MLGCHRHPQRRVSIFATLAPASERQNHTTSPSALGHVRLTCPQRPPHPHLTYRDDRAYVPLHRGGMREKVVLICPTWQAPTPATDWHDGQFAHGVHAEIARRASACAAASRGRHSRERTHRQRDRGKPFFIANDHTFPARLTATAFGSWRHAEDSEHVC